MSETASVDGEMQIKKTLILKFIYAKKQRETKYKTRAFLC